MPDTPLPPSPPPLEKEPEKGLTFTTACGRVLKIGGLLRRLVLYIRKLRSDQQRAVWACMQTDKGQVVAPTGSGKTVVALEVVKRLTRKSKKPFIAVVLVHRILLAKQWIKNANDLLNKQNKLAFNFVNINSGGLSSIIKNEIEGCLYGLEGPGVVPVLSSTNPRDIARRITKLTDAGSNVLIPCTYHSVGMLASANLPVSLVIHDECQTVPGSEMFRECFRLVADKKLFFTATPVNTASDEGWGQNNEALYGPVVFEMKPAKAIKIGAIVGPQIDFVGAEWTADQANDGELRNRDFNALSELVFEAHAKHRDVVKAQSYDPSKIGAKLLVVCNGQQELQGIFNSRTFGQLRRANPNIRIFGLCTEFGIYMNGRHRRPPASILHKEQFLYALHEMGVEEDAIIFHVDMIAEGLDVPSITGMMPLRNFSSTMKFLQNVGRATRPHPEDMKRIESGELEPGDWNRYIKPYCRIVLPSCVRDHNDFVTRYALILDAMRRYYDFDPSQVINVDILNPAQKGPEFDEDALEREIRSTIRDDIERFYYTREQDNLDLQEALIVHRFRRFVTDDEPVAMVKMLGKYA